MGKYHFVHSLWTKPMGNDLKKLEYNAYIYALSVAYLKRLGCSINLHTDSLGKKLLEGIGYDNIYLTAEEIPEEINPKIFAYVKTIALNNEPLGTVYIDGDVFVKTPECLDRIFDHDCDCVVQSCETYILWTQPARTFMTPFLSENLLSNGERLEVMDYDYNTGVIGFFDEALKELYISNYQELAKKLSEYKYLSYCGNGYEFDCPDFVLEQQLIGQLTRNKKLRCVLPLDSMPYDKERNIVAKNIGYTHLLGPTKYDEDVIEKVKERLAEFGMLEKVNKNIKEVLYESK